MYICNLQWAFLTGCSWSHSNVWISFTPSAFNVKIMLLSTLEHIVCRPEKYTNTYSHLCFVSLTLLIMAKCFKFFAKKWTIILPLRTDLICWLLTKCSKSTNIHLSSMHNAINYAIYCVLWMDMNKNGHFFTFIMIQAQEFTEILTQSSDERSIANETHFQHTD